MPVLLAHSLGFYREEGLDVSLENLSSHEKAMQAMVGGSIDVASTSFSQVLYLAAESHWRARG